ncbi:MAG: ABC transporter ATP-binding protein [Bacilli bacterium]|nr:ABC transporter ATP-binding protein [Bacilli bacterium]
MEILNDKKISVININKRYNGQIVLEDISFDIKEGEFISMLGASGCGKTTLLKILIGIETPDSGTILKDGVDITNNLPSKRGMGLVFQNYALFPNMTVWNNVAYALKGKKDMLPILDATGKPVEGSKELVLRKRSKEEIKAIVDEVIAIVGLSDYANKKPGKMSGGQQQRVAIARTLALNPDIILFDEPMAALDADIRMSLRKEIKALQKKFNKTMIYVTHDQEEAFSMSDRIIVMNDNHIAQFDTPNNIYKNPANDFVKKFVVNHLDEKVLAIKNSTK